ncbi:MAG: hypothetical protein ACTSRZ_14710 [Promethearchaeota archaeon]
MMLKTLILHINDAKIFFNLQRKLHKKGIPFYMLDESRLPRFECLIVSDFEGINYFQHLPHFDERKNYFTFLNYENFPNYNILYINIIKSLRSIEDFDKLTCSIDPGEEYIGVAYFLDNYLLSTDVFYDLESMLENINLYILSLNPSLLEFKIGRGNSKPLRDTLNLFLNSNEKSTLNKNFKIQFNAFNIYLVDERGSSKVKKPKEYYFQMQNYLYPTQRLSKHEKAAIIIGMREGLQLDLKSFQKILKRNFSLSEIKRTQDISRKKTNGLFSISREMALNVLEGNISMENAIELQMRKIKNKQKNTKTAKKDK